MKHHLNSGSPKISSVVSMVLILYSLLSRFSFSDTTMQLYYVSLPGATVLRLQFLAPEHYGTIHLCIVWHRHCLFKPNQPFIWQGAKKLCFLATQHLLKSQNLSNQRISRNLPGVSQPLLKSQTTSPHINVSIDINISISIKNIERFFQAAWRPCSGIKY